MLTCGWSAVAFPCFSGSVEAGVSCLISDMAVMVIESARTVSFVAGYLLVSSPPLVYIALATPFLHRAMLTRDCTLQIDELSLILSHLLPTRLAIRCAANTFSASLGSVLISWSPSNTTRQSLSEFQDFRSPDSTSSHLLPLAGDTYECYHSSTKLLASLLYMMCTRMKCWAHIPLLGFGRMTMPGHLIVMSRHISQRGRPSTRNVYSREGKLAFLWMEQKRGPPVDCSVTRRVRSGSLQSADSSGIH